MNEATVDTPAGMLQTRFTDAFAIVAALVVRSGIGVVLSLVVLVISHLGAAT